MILCSVHEPDDTRVRCTWTEGCLPAVSIVQAIGLEGLSKDSHEDTEMREMAEAERQSLLQQVSRDASFAVADDLAEPCSNGCHHCF